MAILTDMLRRLRGQVLGWGVVFFLMAVLAVVRYNLFRENQAAIRQLLDGSLGDFLRMFGDVDRLITPSGFLSLAFFSFMPLVLGVFAILAGSGLIVADEEAGTLDLVLAHPIGRTSLFAGRLLALGVATAAILGLSWLGFVVAMPWSALGVGVGAIAGPYFSLAALMAFFATLGLWLSLVLPARRTAAMTAGVMLVASYFVTTLARLDPGLEVVARFSPIHYYQGGEAIEGLDPVGLVGLLAFAALFAALAWWSFLRRDIRVVGESGWRGRGQRAT